MDFIREDPLQHRYWLYEELLKRSRQPIGIPLQYLLTSLQPSIVSTGVLCSIFFISMVCNPETFVLSPNGVTDSFFTTAGILQGDTLAPYLFIIVEIQSTTMVSLSKKENLPITPASILQTQTMQMILLYYSTRQIMLRYYSNHQKLLHIKWV